MNHAAPHAATATATAAAGLYVGPATVRHVEPDAAAGLVQLDAPTGELRAELALAFPYRPRRGDIVLVLATRADHAFIVGVLHGRGRSTITLPADAEIRAEGRLRIVSPRSIELESPDVKLRADRLELTARALFERMVESYRWIKGVIQTVAGRMRTVVSGTAEQQAGRVQVIAREDVRIDGERINIG